MLECVCFCSKKRSESRSSELKENRFGHGVCKVSGGIDLKTPDMRLQRVCVFSSRGESVYRGV